MGLRGLLVDVTPLRRSPQFRRLWIGGALSGFGGQMTLVAVMFQIWQTTHSTMWTGAVGIAQVTPVIGCGMFAGSVVDHVDRRTFYLVTTIGQAVCSLMLAAQGFLGHVPVTGGVVVATQSCFVARRRARSSPDCCRRRNWPRG
ncbi:MFS transporter [Nocardia sp. NPDC051570]|uniref:MFS transporter n=1 Tax=Nocardia sp. NPDC051570 TaxID=3364324 RepID=UPI0037B41027